MSDEDQTLPPLRMRAYWYAFTETGVRCVDEILSVVACAGKGYHNTESWSEAGYTQQMQDAAGRAAAEINRLKARLRLARNIITDSQNFIHPSSVWRDVDQMQKNIDSFLETLRE